jgi:hypothetical protein
MKRRLDTVTLLGIDCVDIDRLVLAAEICMKDFEFADIKLLTSLPAKGNKHIVPIEEIKSVEEYSKFAITRMNDYIETPHVLIIQHDGFILNPEAWDDDFLKFDYIGAPWLVNMELSVKRFNFPERLIGQHVVGNGGFCIRSKKLTSVLAQMEYEGFFTTYQPEDNVICVHKRAEIEKRGITFAPVPLAQKFSFEAEGSSNYVWNGQLGFHGLKWTDISSWLIKHPEYKIQNDLSRYKNRQQP